MTPPARVRLWASEAEWLDIDFCFAGAEDNDPVFRTKDQWGNTHTSTPPDAQAALQWANDFELTFNTAKTLHALNNLATRTTAAFLRYWLRDQAAPLLAYVRTLGVDEDGADIDEWTYYTLRHRGSLPRHISGTRTGLGGSLPKYTTLKFDVLDEGSILDWDTHDTDHQHSILAASTALDTFEIDGDYAARFTLHTIFRVQGSTGNDAQYICSTNATYDSGSGRTTVFVNTVPDATADGAIYRPNCHTRGERPV